MASENFARYPAACCGELHCADIVLVVILATKGYPRQQKSRSRQSELVYLVHLLYPVDLVCLVYLVGLVQLNRPDRPDEPDRPNNGLLMLSAHPA